MTNKLQEALTQCLAYVAEHYDHEGQNHHDDYYASLHQEAMHHVFGPTLRETFSGGPEATEDQIALLAGSFAEIWKLAMSPDHENPEVATAIMAVSSSESHADREEFKEAAIKMADSRRPVVEFWLVNVPGGLMTACSYLTPPEEGEQDWRFMDEEEKRAAIRFFENALTNLGPDSNLAKMARRRLTKPRNPKYGT